MDGKRGMVNMDLDFGGFCSRWARAGVQGILHGSLLGIAL
jgi:hypothetical protein